MGEVSSLVASALAYRKLEKEQWCVDSTASRRSWVSNESRPRAYLGVVGRPSEREQETDSSAVQNGRFDGGIPSCDIQHASTFPDT